MSSFAQKYPKAAEWIRKGGLAYTLASLTAIFFGECINFPLQRNVTFKSHGPWFPNSGCTSWPLLWCFW